MEKDKCCKLCDGMKIVKLQTEIFIGKDGEKSTTGTKECSVYEYVRLHKSDSSVELIECWCGDCGIIYHINSI